MANMKSKRLPILIFMSTNILLALWFFLLTDNRPVKANQQIATEARVRLQVDSKSSAVIVEPTVQINKRTQVAEVPVINHLPTTVDWGPVEIMRDVYVDDIKLDDFQEEEWDEQAYIEQKRLAYESMTSDELVAKNQLDDFETQLSTETDDVAQDDSIRRQLTEYFIPEVEEQGNKIVDLSCARKVCRVALEVSDEFAQYDVIDAIDGQIEGIEKTMADIEIQPDDHRFVTLYLVRAEQVDDDFTKH